MTKLLGDKTRVTAPDTDYPYGKIRDESITLPGTPANEELYGDIHQFFARLLALSGVTANGLPDNAYSGFQLFEALLKTDFVEIAEYNQIPSSGNFELIVTGSNCTATLTFARYSVIKTGRIVKLKISFNITVSALGVGNSWYNFKIVTPTRAKGKASKTGLVGTNINLSSPNDYTDLNTNVDGDIVSDYDNSFVVSAQQYRHLIDVTYEATS
jgi:hypothetical protein